MSDAVIAPAGMVENLQRFGANMAWAKKNEQVLAEHEGKFVAINDGRIVAVSTDSQELRNKFAQSPFVYVVFVAPRGLAWLL